MDIEERKIRMIFDLYGKYHLTQNDISDFLCKKKSIFDIIANKIYYIYEIAQSCGNKLGEEIINLNLELILISKEDVEQKIIKPIIESKNKIEKLKRISPTSKEMLLNDIDKVLLLIEKSDEIFEKYIIEEYEYLIELDSRYLKIYHDYSNDDYLIQEIKKSMQNAFKWRTLKGYNDIANLIKGNKGRELLRIEDYYIEEICEVYENDYNIEFTKSVEDKEENGLAFENKNLLKIISDNSSSNKLKDCANILLRSSIICKKIYDMYYNEETKKNVIEEINV